MMRDKTNTAILVLGRNASGEECDRRLEGDYYLTEEEKKLVSQVCENFPEVIVILNINGLILTLKHTPLSPLLLKGWKPAVANLLSQHAMRKISLSQDTVHSTETVTAGGRSKKES